MPEPGFAIPDLDALQAEAGEPTKPSAASGTAGTVATVLQRQGQALMAVEGVVMVGQGQDELGQDAIVVGVKQHHQLSGLPKSVEGVRVVGIVIGEVDALSTTRTQR